MAQRESFTVVTRSGLRLPLEGTLLGWQDQVVSNLNEHLILKRSGAIHQWQGQGARRFTARCLLREPGASEASKLIEAALAVEPFCALIHPRYGHLDVVYQTLQGAEDLDQAVNTKEIEIAFSETTLRRTPQPTPATAAAAAGEAVAQLQVLVASRPALVPRAAALWNAVTAFAAQVEAGLSQLAVALATVSSAVDHLLAVAADPVALVPVVAQARLVFGRCLEAYNMAGALGQGTPAITYYVQSSISLPALCVQLYGGESQGYEEQIESLNRIPRPYAIPPGTQLLLPDPDAVKRG